MSSTASNFWPDVLRLVKSTLCQLGKDPTCRPSNTAQTASRTGHRRPRRPSCARLMLWVLCFCLARTEYWQKTLSKPGVRAWYYRLSITSAQETMQCAGHPPQDRLQAVPDTDAPDADRAHAPLQGVPHGRVPQRHQHDRGRPRLHRQALAPSCLPPVIAGDNAMRRPSVTGQTPSSIGYRRPTRRSCAR